MLYEGLKQNAKIVIVPSTAVQSMQLGALPGLTALTGGPIPGTPGTSSSSEPGMKTPFNRNDDRQMKPTK